jgi:hypothetical protein
MHLFKASICNSLLAESSAGWKWETNWTRAPPTEEDSGQGKEKVQRQKAILKNIMLEGSHFWGHSSSDLVCGNSAYNNIMSVSATKNKASQTILYNLATDTFNIFNKKFKTIKSANNVVFYSCFFCCFQSLIMFVKLVLAARSGVGARLWQASHRQSIRHSCLFFLSKCIDPFPCVWQYIVWTCRPLHVSYRLYADLKFSLALYCTQYSTVSTRIPY